jgi:hypothetical protein
VDSRDYENALYTISALIPAVLALSLKPTSKCLGYKGITNQIKRKEQKYSLPLLPIYLTILTLQIIR